MEPNRWSQIINDTDPIRDDLIRCFSPFYQNFTTKHFAIEYWDATRQLLEINKSHPICCNIQGIGRFQVIGGTAKIWFMKSLDTEDYGTEYVIKHSVGRSEYEFMDILSRSEKSRDSTATLHPRYPYLVWNMTDNRTVSMAIMERLQDGSTLKDIYQQFETEESLISFMTRCWRDIQNVRETLWEFQNGHYVHNDVHARQVIVTQNGNVEQCHVVDFGLMFSMDHPPFYSRHAQGSPTWYKLLRFQWNNTMQMKYVEKYGIEMVRKKGWRWKTIAWANMLMVSPLVQFLNRTEDGWPKQDSQQDLYPNSLELNASIIAMIDDTDQMNSALHGKEMAVFENVWCGIKNIVDKLVVRMVEHRRRGVLKNDDFLELMKAHSSNIDQDVKDADIDCIVG